jgi:IS30 family transposase
LNKNTNGLIRRYFTKRSCFETISKIALEAQMNKLYHRPRTTLNYKKPDAACWFIPASRMNPGIALQS